MQIIVASDRENIQMLNLMMTHDDESTDTESEFSGFSSQSEGDLACRLFIAQESLNDGDGNISFFRQQKCNH